MLSNYKVLDLTDEKGSLCGKLLGDLGAEIIKVEKPGGDPARRIGPFVNDINDPEKSLHWFAFNCNKKGITLDIEKPEGREIFKKLSSRADIIIESLEPGYMDKLGIGYLDLSSHNPKLIMTSITPFGQTGHLRDRKISDIGILAMSGLMSITGDPDRPPVRMCLDQTYCLGSAHGTIGTLLAVLWLTKNGEGQHVDVSIYEAAVRGNYWEPARWEFLSELIKRAGNRFPRAAAKGQQLWQCKDGYVTFLIPGGTSGAKMMNSFTKWMEETDSAGALKQINWDNLHLSKVSQEELDVWEKLIAAFLVRFTMDELEQAAIKRGIPMARLNKLSDVAADEQLIARKYWEKINTADSKETISYPAFPFLSSEENIRVRSRAPLIGEHNEEIYKNELGFTDEVISSLKKRGII
ncbi:MAG: CoA transferase [Spirochaetes bacterium]|nr:CoA transferase [Spirochaetota bacterium]